MTRSEATLTEFLRDPNAVMDRLEHVDVVLHRRNAEDLRLSLETRSVAITEAVGVLSRLVGAALDDQAARARLRAEVAQIPWLTFLPDQRRDEFVAEFLRVAEASAALGVMTPVAQLLHEWRNTAAIYANPELAAELKRPLPGDGTRVPAPQAT